MNKENQIFTLVVSLVVGLLLAFWFFNHESSPYFAKNEHTFEFNQLGTMSAGAEVRVNGLLMGRVKEVKLTALKAHAIVDLDAQVKLPIDSKVRIVNVGLVGQRILDIKMGRSQEYFEPGDIIPGAYDMGSVAIVVTATKAIEELSDVFYSVSGVLDSTLFHPSIQKSWARIQSKTAQLNRAISALQSGSTQDFGALFQGLDSLKSNLKEVIEESDGQFTEVKASASEMVRVGKGLSAELKQLSQGIERIVEISKDPEAGAVYHMLHDKQYLDDLNSLLSSWGELKTQIINRTHVLNVDVF